MSLPVIQLCFVFPFQDFCRALESQVRILFCFCYCDKNILIKSSLGRKEFISTYISKSQPIIEGSQGRKLKQKPQRNAVYWLVLWLMLSQLSHTAQTRLPRERCCPQRDLPSHISLQSRQHTQRHDRGHSDQGRFTTEASPLRPLQAISS